MVAMYDRKYGKVEIKPTETIVNCSLVEPIIRQRVIKTWHKMPMSMMTCWLMEVVKWYEEELKKTGENVVRIGMDDGFLIYCTLN